MRGLLMKGLPGHRRQRGVSLLEVLIALVVVAVGLLGVAAMQSIAIQNSQGSHHHTLATTIAYDALDRVRLAMDGRVFEGGTIPSSITDPIQDSYAARYGGRFPDPDSFAVTMAIDGGDVVVTVSWDDEALGVEGVSGDFDVGENAVRVRGRML